MARSYGMVQLKTRVVVVWYNIGLYRSKVKRYPTLGTQHREGRMKRIQKDSIGRTDEAYTAKRKRDQSYKYGQFGESNGLSEGNEVNTAATTSAYP